MSLHPIHTLKDNLCRALGYVWDSSPRWTTASIALIILQGLLPLAGLYLIKILVDVLTEGVAGPDPLSSLNQVILFVFLIGGVALLTSGALILANYVNGAQSRIVTDYMATLLHKKSIEVDLEYYENPQYYNTLHRAQQEASSRPGSILRALLSMGKNSVSLLGIAALLFWFHWGILVALLAAAVPFILVRFRFSRILYNWEKGRTSTQRRAWYLNLMLTRDSHAKEIRLFELGTYFSEQYQAVRSILRRERLSLEGRQSLAQLGAQAFGAIILIGINVMFAYQTLVGSITLGDLVMYLGAVQRGSGFMESLMSNGAYLYESNLFLSNLYEFLDIKRRPPATLPSPTMPPSESQGLTFDHVTFHYPGGTHKVLDDISLTIRPGEHIALVGGNGAGKTSLIKLLSGLYTPTHGRISINGRELREFDLAELRREISVIFQDFAKYHMTAQENIWLGNIVQPADPASITAAAHKAGVDHVIERLPEGYHNILGKWFEGGEELSIGEWQKVALARAFFRNAPIIILDEPTSAMDAKAEYELFQRFHELTKDRTTILISHRLSTVKMVDRVYVLEQGRITESGTHDELLEQKGTYADLFTLQAKPYHNI